MYWGMHNDFVSWWPMGIGLVIWVIIVALAFWLLVRTVGRGASGSGESAEDLLRRRFASGEIDEEEYAKRLEVLRRK